VAASPAFLLDANVLIALTVREHVSRERAHHWFRSSSQAEPQRFATCPITQGALVRFHCREAGSGSNSIQLAKEVLRQLTAHPRHEFWPDDLPYIAIEERGLVGYKQVTDYYLAALARHHNSKLITLDESLAAVLPASCIRI